MSTTTRKKYGTENPLRTRVASEIKRREYRDALLDRRATNRDFAGWVEAAFGVTLSAGIRRMYESVQEHRRTVVLSANSMGKTHGAARLALALWQVYAAADDVENVKVYTAAAPPEENLKKNLWSEISTALKDESAGLFDEATTTTMNVQSAPGAFVTGVTIPASGTDAEREARFSGKHADALFFFIDEGDAVPKPVYDGIESCMSGGSVARLLIMLNPRAPRGEVYRMVKDGEAHVVRLSALDHENIVSGEQRIPGAVDRETVVRRLAQWSRSLAGGEDTTGRVTYEVPDHLVGCTATREGGGQTTPLDAGERVVTDHRLCHMVLGVYPPAGTDQLISREWIEKAQQRWRRYASAHGETPTGGRIGYDVASEGEDRNCVCHRVGDFVRRFAPAMLWKGVDSSAGAQKVNGLYDRLRWARGYVDTGGVGDGVPAQIKHGDVQGVQFGESAPEAGSRGDGPDVQCHRMRDYLYWSVREWLRSDDAMLPPDEGLADELATPTYEKTVKGAIRVQSKDEMRTALGRSPDKLDALALTFAPDQNLPSSPQSHVFNPLS